MNKALVLGSGRVGSVIVADLATDMEVIVVDNNMESLDNVHNPNVTRVHRADCVRHETIQELLNTYDPDIVIGALPSKLGYEALRQVIEAGYNYVDISFMTEDPCKLDQLAREHKVTAVVDMGIMPGLGNIFVGHAVAKLNEDKRFKCTHFKISVGGVLTNPQPPFYYKAGFAPSDVIEEYVRPARMKVDGNIVTLAALTDIEQINFPGIGVFEEFNTDGLRTLLNLDVDNMVEKTIRRPGHAQLMRVFRDAGFFRSEGTLIVPTSNGLASVRPIDVTQKLLFPHWKMELGDEDITLMRVTASNNNPTEPMLWWNIRVGYGWKEGCTSMSRATAYPCTTIARLILEGKISQTGVIVPETLGADSELFAEIIQRVNDKGILIDTTTCCSVSMGPHR